MKKVLIIIVSFLAVITLSFFGYVNIYYHNNSEKNLQYIELYGEVIDDNIYFDVDNSSELGFIIYPGAKVEETAYVSLAMELKNRGYTTVVASFPFRLAFFDSDVASDIIKNRPEIKNWIIVGHSLGGAMASNYINDTDDNIIGMVYLGSYPATDTDVDSLYIYGENDLIVNLDKVPSVDNENVYEIRNGNHAGFANYGPQRNDGRLYIIKREQIIRTVDIIIEYFDLDTNKD